MPRRAQIALAAAVFALSGLPGCFESHDSPLATAANPGSACTTEADCLGGTACVSADFFPGGYCATECGDGCPPDTLCDPAYGGRLCLAGCAEDSECREGYHCFANVCRPPCRGEFDCGRPDATCIDERCRGPECVAPAGCAGGRVCVDGRCVTETRDAGMDLPPGAPCAGGGECASGLCLPPELGGICAEPCDSRLACSFTETCTPAPIDADGDGGPDFVTPACVEGNPDGRFVGGSCASAEQCESRTCIAGQCTEACVVAYRDCLPGQACVSLDYPAMPGGTFTGCGYEARGGMTETEDFPLGEHALAVGGVGTRVNFAIPNDAVSVTLIARNTSGDLVPIAYRSLDAPDDTRLFDLEGIASFIDQPVRWLPINNDETATISVPSSTPDRVRILGGRYGARVILLPGGPGIRDGAEVELTMRVKRAADISRGTIDLDVYLVGLGFDSTGAPGEARLTDAIDNLRGIWDAVGLSLGSVTYRDVADDVASRLSIIDSLDGPTSELAELFRLSRRSEGDVLSIFMVRSISAGGDGGIVLGIAGGIPGPPSVYGTMHSGVAVSYDSGVVGGGARGSQNIAQIVAHETGHYLGLYHVRERLAPCPAGTGPTDARPCAPFGGGDVLADPSARDGENLMWWALGGDTGRRYNVALSPGQSSVLLRSPVVGR